MICFFISHSQGARFPTQNRTAHLKKNRISSNLHTLRAAGQSNNQSSAQRLGPSVTPITEDAAQRIIAEISALRSKSRIREL